MDDSISGSSGIPPDQMQIYKQDFAQAANLFQQSLSEYQKSTIPAQQQAFKEVMQKAMNIMNEISQICLSQSAQKKEVNLNQTFQEFENNPSAANAQALNQSINKLNKSL